VEVSVMSLIAKIKRLITGRREPEQEKADDDASKKPDEYLGGGSPHDMGGAYWAGSFRDE
jgi:hypothetical protein